MDRKKWKITTTVVIAIAVLFSAYWIISAKPGAFHDATQLIDKINDVFPQAQAKVIQDTIKLDDKHIVVPFISENDDYGLSYWVWKHYSWKLVYVSTRGLPELWKLGNDPSTYHIVWNLHPDSNVDSLHFYMERHRGYRVSRGIEHYYYPKIQLDEAVSLEGKTYGSMKLWDDWSATIRELTNNQIKKPISFEDKSLAFQNIIISFMYYDRTGEHSTLMKSYNGRSYYNGKIDTEFLFFTEKARLESIEDNYIQVHHSSR